MTNLPRPINRDEIRKGDKIQVEYTDNDIQVIIVGVADNQAFSTEWYTTKGMLLTRAYSGVEYSLIDRPKPLLPTKKGAVIRITKIDEGPVNYLAQLDDDGDWAIVTNGGAEYFQPKHILEWNNVTITDVKED